MRRINNIVIHCQAGHSDKQSMLNWWHSPKPNGLGWRTGGYHIWVDYDGSLHQLHPFETVTNGVREHNSDSIHICYRGGVRRDNHRIAEDTRTEEQKAGILNAILKALKFLKQYQDVSDIRILGHRDFPGVTKDCPSFSAIPEYSWITA